MTFVSLSRLGLAFAAASLTLATLAQETVFRIGGRASQQLASVESETDFETFTGRTDKVSGTIRFDPAKRTGSGRIEVDVAAIDTGIALRNEHMLAANWMDAAKFPKITFETTKVEHVQGDRYRVTGNFTMRGVTKPITVEATVRHLPESQATRGAGFRGDVLQVRTSFNVKISEYGVRIPAQAASKVADTVKISISVYAQSGS